MHVSVTCKPTFPGSKTRGIRQRARGLRGRFAPECFAQLGFYIVLNASPSTGGRFVGGCDSRGFGVCWDDAVYVVDAGVAGALLQLE